MEWIVIVVLLLTTIKFVALYCKGIRERMNLRSLLLQILLDVETYKTQKEGLSDLVKNMPSVNNAMDLSHRVK